MRQTFSVMLVATQEIKMHGALAGHDALAMAMYRKERCRSYEHAYAVRTQYS